MYEAVIDLWFAAGWMLRRAGCLLNGHRWPQHPAGTIGVWERCGRCDGYRYRQWWDRSKPAPPLEFGRGRLPRCGLPMINPWRRSRPHRDELDLPEDRDHA